MKAYFAGLLLGVVLLGLFGVQSLAQTADKSIPYYRGPFRWGNNAGYTSGWSDADKIALGPAIGMNSRRVKLPEYHLEAWGYAIEVSDSQTAAAAGQNYNTAFLVGSSDAHTTNPSPNYSNEQYPPKNLYEPIWINKATKEVNPNNYWAIYIQKLWNNYDPYVAIYEIWNEPDFTGVWDVTFGRSDNNDWWHRAPLSSELTNWQGTNFFSYVRLLRITYEVLHTMDPNAMVAIGGIGYYSFVDALCRYTDNPVDGSVTTAYPKTGCSYFDVTSNHYYPHFSTYDLTTQVWNKNKDSDTWASNFITHKKNFETVLTKYNYGKKKPAKISICTENGVSSWAEFQGGDKTRRNYLMKVAILAKANYVGQIHVYNLNDDGSDSGTFQTMGSYGALGTNKSPTPKSSSLGGKTMSGINFWAAVHDPVRTATLKSQLPTGYIGYAFGINPNKTIYAIWKRVTVNGSEAGENVAAGSVSFSSPGSTLSQYKWNWATTKTTTKINKVSGKFTATVDGTPSFFIDTATNGMSVNGIPKIPLGGSATPASTTASVYWRFNPAGFPPEKYQYRYRKASASWPTTYTTVQFGYASLTALTKSTAYQVEIKPVSIYGTGPSLTVQFTTTA